MTCRISNSVKFAILAWQQLLQIIIQVAEIIGQLLGFYTAIHCLYHIRPFMLIREAFKKKKNQKNLEIFQTFRSTYSLEISEN